MLNYSPQDAAQSTKPNPSAWSGANRAVLSEVDVRAASRILLSVVGKFRKKVSTGTCYFDSF
jgi:hypothetical protein